MNVEAVVSHPSPDRLTILTYISQFYHKLAHSGSDSRVFSLSQSPASSDCEAESSAERRGEILSLMDGRREGRSEVGRPSSPPIEKGNPFKKEFSKNSENKPEKKHFL